MPCARVLLLRGDCAAVRGYRVGEWLCTCRARGVEWAIATIAGAGEYPRRGFPARGARGKYIYMHVIYGTER